jgi:hypothetical protein
VIVSKGSNGNDEDDATASAGQNYIKKMTIRYSLVNLKATKKQQVGGDREKSRNRSPRSQQRRKSNRPSVKSNTPQHNSSTINNDQTVSTDQTNQIMNYDTFKSTTACASQLQVRDPESGSLFDKPPTYNAQLSSASSINSINSKTEVTVALQ